MSELELKRRKDYTYEWDLFLGKPPVLVGYACHCDDLIVVTKSDSGITEAEQELIYRSLRTRLFCDKRDGTKTMQIGYDYEFIQQQAINPTVLPWAAHDSLGVWI